MNKDKKGKKENNTPEETSEAGGNKKTNSLDTNKKTKKPKGDIGNDQLDDSYFEGESIQSKKRKKRNNIITYSIFFILMIVVLAASVYFGKKNKEDTEKNIEKVKENLNISDVFKDSKDKINEAISPTKPGENEIIEDDMDEDVDMVDVLKELNKTSYIGFGEDIYEFRAGLKYIDNDKLGDVNKEGAMYSNSPFEEVDIGRDDINLEEYIEKGTVPIHNPPIDVNDLGTMYIYPDKGIIAIDAPGNTLDTLIYTTKESKVDEVPIKDILEDTSKLKAFLADGDKDGNLKISVFNIKDIKSKEVNKAINVDKVKKDDNTDVQLLLLSDNDVAYNMYIAYITPSGDAIIENFTAEGEDIYIEDFIKVDKIK